MRLDDLRAQIDSLDRKIVDLLNKRARIAMDVALLKTEAKSSFYAPVREKKVYDKVSALNDGPLPDQGLRNIYREIMSATLALEKPLQVAFLGPLYTFTHMACINRFGSSIGLRPAPTIEDVFLKVERNEADYGVVPVENSTEGVVNYTLDMFMDSQLKICGEVFVEITHNLLSASALSEVKRLYTHPQALAQCRSWLRSHLPDVEVIEVSSTSKAAEMAASETGSAAIASTAAAENYGLSLLGINIEDTPNNRTRFLVIGREGLVDECGKDKTSVMFSVRHRAGALYSALKSFEAQKVNMTMIESRPTKKRPWEYVFFIDVQGHFESPQVSRALADLEEKAIFLRILGSYPEAD